MDGQEKENFIRNYVERQRAYLSAYCKDDLHPSGSPAKVPNSGAALGFDTPVLQPRTLRSSGPPPPKLRDEQRLQCPRRVESLANRQLPRSSPSRAVASNADNVNEKRPAGKKCSKKTRTPPSDREREARLAERRERKRRKREIVKSPGDGDDGCGRRSSKPRKKCKTTPSNDTSTPATFAILHGFSATNVKKDRLTLKPSLHPLGVFFKGKASAKTRVSSKKRAPRTDAFSELAFLSKAKITSGKDDGDSETGSSSGPHQPSQPLSDRDDTPNHRSAPDRDEQNQKMVGDHLQAQELPGEHQSVVWDIESQNGCPPDVQNSPTGSAEKASASVVMDVRASRWFVPADTSKVPDPPEIESEPSPSERGSLRSRSLLCPSESGKAVLLHDGEDSSLHPSHSASQAEYHRRCSFEDAAVVSAPRQMFSSYFSQPCPAILPHTAVDANATGTHYFIQDPLVGPQIVQEGNRVTSDVDSVLGELSLPSFDMPCGPTAYEIRGGWRDNSAVEASSQPPGAFPVEDRPFRDTFATHEQPETSPSYDDQCYYEMVDDRRQLHTLNGAIDCPPSDAVRFYDGEVPWYDGDIPVMDDLGIEENFDPWPGSHVGDRESSDAIDGHDQDIIGEAGFDGAEWEYEAYPAVYGGSVSDDIDDYCVWQHDGNELASSVWEDAEGEQAQVSNFSEGRALLLGISTPPRSRRTSGLFKAELDVVTRLRDHWQRQRL
ncbi:hypothetical protein PISMIDRAFT_5985 [Pisolithus microcarpus 441]|uniref:Uncharacterized protein n=1 Tax=Pisolithus microcarpus 441 TaxID=765257 RepID=A0A0D0AET7_9AGAM|nr:hypothetical protein PISMIDRAFT_5985 [Pisolithus microcarpus 441]